MLFFNIHFVLALLHLIINYYKLINSFTLLIIYLHLFSLFLYLEMSLYQTIQQTNSLILNKLKSLKLKKANLNRNAPKIIQNKIVPNINYPPKNNVSINKSVNLKKNVNRVPNKYLGPFVLNPYPEKIEYRIWNNRKNIDGKKDQNSKHSSKSTQDGNISLGINQKRAQVKKQQKIKKNEFNLKQFLKRYGSKIQTTNMKEDVNITKKQQNINIQNKRPLTVIRNRYSLASKIIKQSNITNCKKQIKQTKEKLEKYFQNIMETEIEKVQDNDLDQSFKFTILKILE